MKSTYFKIIVIGISGVILLSSCKKFLDINHDPENIPASNAPMDQVLTSAQINLAFEAGADLFRYSTLFAQQMSGEASAANQTWAYYRYNVSPTDVNNSWGSIFSAGNGPSGTLKDLEIVINKAAETGSPYYGGICKMMKAYEYSLVVDAWGNVPYSEAEQLTGNTNPHYDKDSTIYPKLITLLNDGINDLNAASSTLIPGTASVLYPNSTFSVSKPLWIKFANTLKLRLYLHYSRINPAFTVSQITALVNSGATFFASNSDNFQMIFNDAANQRCSITQFEVSRPNYLFADSSMLGLMKSKNDPRRGFYFTSQPYIGVSLPFTLTTSAASAGTTLTFVSTTSGANTAVIGLGVTGVNVVPGTKVTAVTATSVTLDNALMNTGAASGATIVFSPVNFVGVSGANPPAAANNNYSRVHVFLRGNVTAGTTPPFTYSGTKPQRMLSFAEYNFIRAEAALMGAPGSAQTFFTAGITASMQEVGVSQTAINDYLQYNGTLTGTPAQQLRQIIEEKYVASFGVSMEPWTDYRRTGYPVLAAPIDHIAQVPNVPRSLFYPQNEIDRNSNAPTQKSSDMQTKVFWDN